MHKNRDRKLFENMSVICFSQVQTVIYIISSRFACVLWPYHLGAAQCDTAQPCLKDLCRFGTDLELKFLTGYIDSTLLVYLYTYVYIYYIYIVCMYVHMRVFSSTEVAN